MSFKAVKKVSSFPFISERREFSLRFLGLSSDPKARLKLQAVNSPNPLCF
jgi:hypothetical protein